MSAVVQNRTVVTDCPRFKFSISDERCLLLYRMPASLGPACNWTVDVVGDPDGGGYEWLHRDETGRIVDHSDDGYGSTYVAMRDGLVALDAL